MKQMAVRPLVRLPDGRTIEEADVAPLSRRIVHIGEFLGWALMTFAVLYFGLHFLVSL